MSQPISSAPNFATRIAHSAADIRAAQRLRYRVFIEELGGDGDLVDHTHQLERDVFDDAAEQLILLDQARPEEDQVVGVYRLMDRKCAAMAGRFYSEVEYDLSPLLSSGRPVLELGRSCLHQDYRGGSAMMYLWQALAELVAERGTEVLFGVASFHGTDLKALAAPLSLLQRDHLAPPELRTRSRYMAVLPELSQLDKVAAMKQVPALIKAYLRLGGFVGEGVFVDHAFNTTDVCLILDTGRLSARHKAIYTRDEGTKK